MTQAWQNAAKTMAEQGKRKDTDKELADQFRDQGVDLLNPAQILKKEEMTP